MAIIQSAGTLHLKLSLYNSQHSATWNSVQEGDFTELGLGDLARPSVMYGFTYDKKRNSSTHLFFPCNKRLKTIR